MWNVLVDTGDAGIEILGAYVVKEDLRALLALSGTNPDRAVIRERLFTFYNRAATSTSPEVHRLAATVEAWWPAIEAAITTDYSNARSEGHNRLANPSLHLRAQMTMPSSSTSTRPATEMTVSITDQLRIVSPTVMPKYSLTSQNPASLTWLKNSDPAPMASTSSDV